MDEKSDNIDQEKNIDDFMLPGFRFHPTDEELVEFYLKRKLQHKSLPIELIKQVDIYKYDPWDLPKLASTGEKEWYFYCPRDRKYRNSTRPNRVTGSGFWKATGTDRPIYSSDGTKCIGLKKSLVFYRGRAAKGIKTDWMMHEFRLPSVTDGAPTPPNKRILDKNIPAPDSWAICRIFKKTNSMAHRALSHPWITPSLSQTTSPPPPPNNNNAFTYHTHFFNSENISSITEHEHDFQHTNLSPLNFPSSYKTISTLSNKPLSSPNVDFFPANLVFSPHEEVSNKNVATTVDLTSESTGLEATSQHEFNDIAQSGISSRNATNVHDVWENIRSMGFPFSLPTWESPACPSEISSTNYSNDNCCYR